MPLYIINMVSFSQKLSLLCVSIHYRCVITTHLAAYQCEGIGGGGPPTHSGQWPGLKHLVCCLVHPNALPGDSQETRDQLVATFQLLIHQEVCHSIHTQGAT